MTGFYSQVNRWNDGLAHAKIRSERPGARVMMEEARNGPQ